MDECGVVSCRMASLHVAATWRSVTALSVQTTRVWPTRLTVFARRGGGGGGGGGGGRGGQPTRGGEQRRGTVGGAGTRGNRVPGSGGRRGGGGGGNGRNHTPADGDRAAGGRSAPPKGRAQGRGGGQARGKHAKGRAKTNKGDEQPTRASKPRTPLVFDDSCKGSDVFPPWEDREITLAEQLAFERKGHVCVRGVLRPDEASEMVAALIKETKARQLEAFRHRVSVLCPGFDASRVTTVAEAMEVLERHSTEEVGFLQTFNLHRDARPRGGPEAPGEGDNHASPGGVAAYILSKRLAKVAAQLLGVEEDEKLRLYQSCVFSKPPGFGETHWHSDANMVPLDTNRFVTLWLPLRPLTEDDAALVFASGSHRDFSLPYWHSLEGMSDLSGRGYEVESYEPLDLGDATAHAGWCLHWSPPQPEDCPPRYALSVCYFVDGARRLVAKDCRKTPETEDEWSYREWLGDIAEGEPARHPALPVVYP